MGDSGVSQSASGETSNVSSASNTTPVRNTTSSELQPSDFAMVMRAAVETAVREAMMSASGQAGGTVQPDPSGRHVLAESGKLVPTFNPTEDARMSATEWISRVDDLASAYGWNDKQTCCYALLKLEGVAKTWYEGVCSSFTSWAEWRDAIQRAFPDTVSSHRRFRDMETRKRHKNETIEQYYYDKLTRCRRCKLEDTVSVEYIIAGLNDPEYARALGPTTFSCPEDLLCALKRIDDRISSVQQPSARHTSGTQATLNDQKGDVPKKDTVEGRKGPRCYNCNVYGHISSNCPHPQKSPRCTNCKKLGHSTSDCRDGAPDRKKSSSVHHLHETDRENANTKYFMDAKVNDKVTQAYLDLGSQCVTLRQSDAESLQVAYHELRKPYSISGYGSGKVVPVGEARARIKVDQAVADVELYVVPDDAQKIPLLVGQPFTEQEHVTVVRRRNTVRVFEEPIIDGDNEDASLLDMKIPELPRRRVSMWSSEATVIPRGFVGFVNVSVSENTLPGDMYIEAQFRPQLGREHCIPRCVVTVDDHRSTCLPVVNVSSCDITFGANECVVRAEPCAEEKALISLHTASVKKIKHPIDLSSVKLGPNMATEDREKLLKLLKRYRECFASTLPELGCTNLAEMHIDLTTDVPVTFRPYRLSHAERETLGTLVGDLKSAGIIVDSNSPYASPVLLVRKKTGESRLCIDYRALNRVTKPDRYPLPLMDDQLDRLRGNCYFTSLDLASGYYQVPIAKDSQYKTAFVTPDGQFEFVRMPFGLTNAPAVFQRMINTVLGPLRYSVAMAYMDDILIPSVTINEGLQHLEEVLRVLKDAGLTLRLSKCHFFQDQVDYLGYEVTAKGISPGGSKTESIRSFPRPTDVHSLRQFLGLTGHFRRFVKGYASIALPLTRLTAKDAPWEWTTEQEEAFVALKRHLIERPILAHYSPSAKTQVHTDASQEGLGAILMQENDGMFHPVSYASRRTTVDERKYHSHELETLAIVWALEKFRVYVLGLQFTVVTDCDAVRCTLTKRNLLPRIGRWWLRLQEFTFDVEHRPGLSMTHVDALSRSPVGEPEDTETANSMVLATGLSDEDWLAAAQASDPKIREIKMQLEKTENLSRSDLDVKSNYVLKRNRVYRKVSCHGDAKMCWVVPNSVRWRIVSLCHDSLGHFGLEKTMKKLEETYWFPRMKRYVRRYLASCLDCLYNKTPSGKRPGYLHSIKKVGVPFHTLHLDHLGPFPRSKRGNSYLIVAVDGFTTYVILRAARSTAAAGSAV